MSLKVFFIRLRIFFIRLHKWAALVVGIQVFFWVAGGLLMSLLDIDEVHGELTRAAIEPQSLQWDGLVPADLIAGQLPLPIAELSLTAGFFGPLYRVTDTRGVEHRFDARTGKPLAEIGASQALEIAQANYAGEGKGQAPIRLSEKPPIEYRGRLPVWRVDFDDDAATTLYVAVDDGEVITRRNRIWRIYDFAWMLHIMDYRERENFNHPLLVGASILAFVVTLSGLYLIGVTSWRNEARRLRKRG